MIIKSDSNFGICFKFFSLIYFFSFWAIIPIISVFINKYGFYRDSNFSDLVSTLNYTIPFYVLVFFTYFFLNSVVVRLKVRGYLILNKSVNTKNKAKYFSYLLLSFSLFALFFLFFKRGFTLGSVGYDEQFELNSGNGLYLIFLYLYLPAISILALIKENSTYIDFLKFFILSIFFGFMVYQFTGGSRNVFLGGVITVIFIFYYKRVIALSQIFIILSILVVLAAYFAILRYSTYLEGADLEYYAFLFTIDSFSPIDTLVNIIRYYHNNNNLLGFDYFFTQFYTFIPRLFWADKPILLYTNAMHITQTILYAPGGVVFSPSIVGTSIAMLGVKLYFLMAFLTGLLIYLVDFFIKSKSIILVAIGFCVLPLSFFLVRENVEIFLYRFILTFMSVFIMYFFYKILFNLLRSRG